MSTRLSTLSALPDGLGATEHTAGQQQIGVASVVAVAWVGRYARDPAGMDASAMPAEVGSREAQAVDVRPQVYCRRHGTDHAAEGLAPCSDLGCAGCTRESRDTV